MITQDVFWLYQLLVKHEENAEKILVRNNVHGTQKIIVTYPLLATAAVNSDTLGCQENIFIIN